MAATTRKPRAKAPVKVKAAQHQWKKLTILITDEEGKDTPLMDHVDIHDGVFNLWNDTQEIVSNPAFAAALAGASPEVIANLPGESVAYLDLGSEIELTYKVRFHTVGGKLSEFRPR
jgi:hypothetical protein